MNTLDDTQLVDDAVEDVVDEIQPQVGLSKPRHRLRQ